MMLEYSTEALNVKSIFYNKALTIYVEGKDDIHFWDNQFKHCNAKNYHIEETPSGKLGLLTYMDKIIEEDAQIIVACDSDYEVLMPNKKYNHKRIIKTYGYSIENSMYCPHNINQLIKRFGRIKKDFEPEIQNWYNEFVGESRILLIYDLANHIFLKGIQVMGDKCVRFLLNDRSSQISNVKVQRFIVNLSQHFTEDQIRKSRVLISKSKKELRFLLKGHFLTNGVINLFKDIIEKETGSNVTISLDSLYSLTVSCIGRCTIGYCKDKEFLKRKIRHALQSIN